MQVRNPELRFAMEYDGFARARSIPAVDFCLYYGKLVRLAHPGRESQANMSYFKTQPKTNVEDL